MMRHFISQAQMDRFNVGGGGGAPRCDTNCIDFGKEGGDGMEAASRRIYSLA